jgi:cytochrome c6
VVVGLSTGNKIGLGAAAVVFILFAVVSSLVVPRRRPDFPARRGLPLFIVATVILFAAQMTAVQLFGEDDEAAEAHDEAAPAEQPATTRPEAAAGAGKRVFASAGCGGCHVLADAGSAGTAGPSLDELKPSAEDAAEQVRNGGGGMPAFEDQLTEGEITAVAEYVATVAGKE